MRICRFVLDITADELKTVSQTLADEGVCRFKIELILGEVFNRCPLAAHGLEIDRHLVGKPIEHGCQAIPNGAGSIEIVTELSADRIGLLRLLLRQFAGMDWGGEKLGVSQTELRTAEDREIIILGQEEGSDELATELPHAAQLARRGGVVQKIDTESDLRCVLLRIQVLVPAESDPA